MDFTAAGIVVDNARSRVNISNQQSNAIAVYSTSGELLTTIQQAEKRPGLAAGAFPSVDCRVLEQIPQELVIDVMVILHLGRLYECSQRACAAISGSLL